MTGSEGGEYKECCLRYELAIFMIMMKLFRADPFKKEVGNIFRLEIIMMRSD